MHPLDLQKNIHCLRCNGFQQDQNFIEISYKLLIKEHDHKIRKEEEFFNLMKTYALNPIEVRNANEEENEILKNLKRANLFYIKSDNDKIPVLLRRLHPKLTNKEYMEIRGLMEFQEHKILICQDCYMDLIQYLQYAGGQENLLEMIKQKAKSQKHKSNDLTIRRLENLKKPLYKANQVMHDKMKMICSYFRQKRCGQSFYNSSEDLPQINDKTNKKFNSKVNLNLTRESSLNFTINSKFLKRDSYKEQVDSLIEKYIEEPKEKVSVFKRLEDKIKPIVRARNKNYSVKYTSLHTFSNLKVSFDSATTNVTNSQLNKNEKELLYNY